MAEKIDTPERYDNTPAGQYSLWMVELDAAKENLAEAKERAQKTVDRFLDVRDDKQYGERHLNLFTSNVQTLRALLYGRVPNVDVTRRFGDANDDVARVSAEVLERCLNSDIERDGDGFKDAIGSALDDRLIAGFGSVRLRYVVETGTREVPPQMAQVPVVGPDMVPTLQAVEIAPGYTQTYKVSEDVETDYVFWGDLLWSPCRTWADARWVAFGVQMTREDLVRRFGEDLGNAIPLSSHKSYSDGAEAKEIDDVWGRAYIWEIWDKASRNVVWVCEDYASVLDTKPDPLGLAGFFPCPRPLLANVTTSALVPVPDYYFAQDQYREVDELTCRISTLQGSIAVRGVYDSASGGIKALIAGGENELIPVENWAMFAEKGGIKGQVDWFPLEMVVATMRQLDDARDKLIAQLYQITGLSDIVRGQAQSSATATEQSIKARFASVRLQALQDEVSRFASDTQKIRAEIISAHFDDQTILERANFAGGNDSQFLPDAMRLLREKFAGYRIEIKPENINLTDAATMKNERMEFVGALMQGVEVMGKVPPPVQAMLAETLQWALASFKGSSQIEGTYDRFVSQMQAMAQAPKPPPQPDPKMQQAMIKARSEKEKIQAGLQADLVRTAAETQAEVTKQTAQAKSDLVVERAREDAAIRAEERAAAKEAVRMFTGI